MTLVTRSVTTHHLTVAKHKRLVEMAVLCGAVRTEVWRRYGALAGLTRSNRTIRDEDWLAGPRLGVTTGLPARIWKATLEDSLNAIKANREAAMAAVIRIIWRSKRDKDEKKRLSASLRNNTWPQDKLLHRLMRKAWRRGQSHISDQIVLDTQGHSSFDHNGQRWLAVSSLVPRKRIMLPLGQFDRQITGAIRLRVRSDGEVDVLHAVNEADACVSRPCGTRDLGVDKGYTEVFVDSDGQAHGEGFGALLSTESDHLKTVWAARRKLDALAAKLEAQARVTSDPAARRNKLAKAKRIRRHNLGRQKLAEHKRSHRAKVRTKVFTACHSVFDKAASLTVEDLRRQIRGYDRGRNRNRRLAGWVKGLIQEAVEATSRRRGALVDEVNAAYTSQWLTGCEAFGPRHGDAIHCPLGKAVFTADHVAAMNILQRKTDRGISRFLPYREVRKVLEERSRQIQRPCLANGRCGVDESCLRLPRRDSSCGVSTQVETAINGERIIGSGTIEYLR